MGSCNGEGTALQVRMSTKDVVAAVLPLQEYWLPLSNLDLLLPKVDVGIFFCFAKPATMSSNSDYGPVMVGRLKKALSQTLVAYYAFAGEVVVNTFGEPELLCNNRGVDFVEAFSDVGLQDLDLYNPDDTVEGKLVPHKKHGVLAVQVTELKCGGIVVGCTFDHRIADAYSANMFLMSWAETAQSKPISTIPSFRRSMLNPRRPGVILPSLCDMYVPVTSLPPPSKQPISDSLISRIYYISSDQLSQLQSLCKRTKLESFSAFLWKMVARSAQKDNMANSCYYKTCKMGIVVDGRTRLNDNDKNDNTNGEFNSYFGNVLSIPYGGMEIVDLVEKPMSWVADQVHEFLKNAANKEHFLGLIDWVEAHRPVPGLARIYCCTSEDHDGGPAFVISSGQHFPIRNIDFGWGKPVFGSYHFPWGGEAGYVMPMPSPSGNGDWVVYMHLLRKQLELIETEASHILRPFTFDCLN